MEAKHTPTPWHVSIEEKTRRDDVYIIGNPTGAIGGARQLAYMVETWTGANTEANAAFIVRAVNSHEQLVAALRDIINYAEACDDDSIELDNARTALAAAGAA